MEKEEKKKSEILNKQMYKKKVEKERNMKEW